MIFSAFEWMVAARYLRSRRRDCFISIIAWFSLLGITLGVSTLIIVMSVMNGFRTELMTRILGLNGHIGVYAKSSIDGITEFDDLIVRICQIPNVIKVTPMIEGQVMATSSTGNVSGAMVRGVRPSDLLIKGSIIDNIRSGDSKGFLNNNAVIVGYRLAEKLGLNIGDAITIISPKGNVTAFGTVPRMQSYRIVATFNVGMYEYDSNFIFMPLEIAQIYFMKHDCVNDLQVMLSNPDNIKNVIDNIKNVTANSFRIYDWKHVNIAFFNAIQVERNVMFLILMLIILVATFNIISSLIMMVNDNGSNIAILRTIGATRGMIMRIFFILGSSIGIIGTLCGVSIGLAFALNIEKIRQFLQVLTKHELFSAEIYFLSQLPSKVDQTEVLIIVIIALILSFIATIYPSWRASKVDPAEALRYE
ncbi:MAG: lipoprotein-releasing ABC transporter permease subunit [Rhodospirillaceae bacterium]|jgi:lipoprotein-releasing system permease protein|nr:lipoprotein-releasing ABC transporter permease subunit [Rhodospirillaceae bacterium]